MGYQAPQTDPVLALKPLTLWTSGCGLPSCRPADRMGAGVQRRSPEQAQTGPKRARPPMHTNTATSSCCQCGWSHGGRASSLLSMVAGGPAGPRQHISLGPQVQCLAASSWLAGRPEACGGQPEGVGHLSVLVGSPGACCGDRAAWKVSLARAKACSRVADVHPCKRQQRSLQLLVLNQTAALPLQTRYLETIKQDAIPWMLRVPALMPCLRLGPHVSPQAAPSLAARCTAGRASGAGSWPCC